MKRRGLTALSIILILTMVLAACSKSTTSTDSSAAPDATETAAANAAPVKVKIFTDQDPHKDMLTSEYTKTLENQFNMKFDFDIAPKDGAVEKRQISIASGDYPDAYLLIPWIDRFQQNELLKYSEQGLILPLNDLIKEYAPNIQAGLDKNPFYKAMVTAPDGKIYGLTQLNDCYHCSYPNKMWINTKWLKTVGMEVPKTTDEFKKVLEAFKTKDPNGNNKKDEVPLSGSTEEYGTHIVPFLMNGFIYDDDKNYLIVDDAKKVDFAPVKPEWKQGLEYIKSLYDEGLIDPGSFTQNWDALKKIGDNADAELLGSAAAMHPDLFVTTGTTAGSDPKYSKFYAPLAPLAGPNSAYATYNYPVMDGASFVITNKASKEAQIAIIKMIDYFFTEEGQLNATVGKEGQDWRRPEAGEVAIEESAKPLFFQIPLKPNENDHNASWGATAQYFQTRDFRNGWVQATDIYAPTGYERRLQEATHLYDGKQPKNPFPNWAIWVDPATSDEAATLKLNIKTYVDSNALQFITGSKDLSKDWDSYVKGLEKLKLPRLLEIMQSSYDVYSKSAQ